MMEFQEKLQLLRKQKGLTQEEVAAQLYVSRAAVSKWESGRGYPNIDSLKAIAAFYGVTIDALLSGEEALNIAADDHRQKQARLRALVFGLLDCSVAMLLFLPFFGQSSNGIIREVSLLALTGIAPYLRAAYLVIVFGIIVCGVLSLALRGCAPWEKRKTTVSLILNASGVLLFTISRQPYGAVFLLFSLGVKALILTKKQ